MASISDIFRSPIVRLHFVVLAHVLPFLLLPASGFGQAENVPATHPVYDFLKRMEVKGEIEKYHDVVLPLSRRQVAEFLAVLNGKRDQLTSAEQGYLTRYMSELAYELRDSTSVSNSLVDEQGFRFGDYVSGFGDDRQKYLYSLTDSNVTFFFNGILNAEARVITGDALGDTSSQYVQFGGRLRGTIYGHLGYYLEGKNASFWGSRELLQRDKVIGQAYTLGVTNTRNFDFVEGYTRYDGKIVSVELGRERVLWGSGLDQKMILSDYARVFDFVRVDVEYKSLKYTFMHAWILGKGGTNLVFSLPSDTTATFVEPVVADKYIAAHRLEFSFPGVFDIGAQEMVIYSNRSVDLAYLNPVTLIESAQRSREERDNVFWAFDIQTRFIPDIELAATFLLDDLNFPDLFTDLWSNRWGGQASLFYADPFTLRNTSLMVEYTRVEPYVFS
ncbi:MAG TPA: hypothetical protein DGH68_11445, partial [Bacteroidetes bacterium]|nr:hypothetical protein [Bacteroidota bacterium]